MSDTTKKYVIFLVILIVGVVADQLTKLYAADRLATTVPGHIEHPITLEVPESAGGDSLESYLSEEFSANTPEEIDTIINDLSHGVVGADGQRLGAETQLEAGQKLTVYQRTVTVVDGYWEWEYAENRGAAFSFLAGQDSPWRMPFLIGVSFLSFFVILYFLRHVRLEQRIFVLALSLIGAGAIGNLIDRVRLGYVIDFILWKWGEAYRWPNFNLADVYITVGAVTVFAIVLFGEFEEPGLEEE